jgi:hypothetical protein
VFCPIKYGHKWVSYLGIERYHYCGQSSNRPGYYNPKLGSEPAADTEKKGFEVGRDGEGTIRSSLLKLQYCKPQSPYLLLHNVTRQVEMYGARPAT